MAYELAGVTAVHSTLADFRAFWCAGSAVLHGADPYRTASLSACEHASAPFGLYTAPSGVVVPAPLPPYALTAFAPFALLAYPAAACVWFCVLIAALVASLRLLAQTLGVPLRTAAWLLVLPATVLWLPFGETAPIALLGAVLAARSLQLQHWFLAVLGLVLLAIEPHLAMGAWICVAAAVGRLRVPLAAAGALLVAASFAAGAALPAEYVLRVLPLHALAELPRSTQYSAAWLLDATGVAPSLALRAGSLSYALLLAGGILVAVRLRARRRDPSVLVYAPLAFAVLGGAFIHASQIALAVPFAAALALRERRQIAVVAAIACATLTVPWLQGGEQQIIVLAGVAVATSAARLLLQRESAVLGAMAVWALLAVLLIAAHRIPQSDAHRHARVFPVASGELASIPWGETIWREQSGASIADWLGKAPSWIALLLVVSGAAIAAAHKEPVLAIRVDEAPAVP